MLRRKTGALILAAVMAVGSMTTTALAAQPLKALTSSSRLGVSPYWLNVSTASTSLSGSSSALTLRANVRATKSTADLDGTLYLEQKVSGSWTEVESWSVSGTGKLSASETSYDPGTGTFRSRAVVTVDGETVEVLSASKTV